MILVFGENYWYNNILQVDFWEATKNTTGKSWLCNF